MRWIAGPDQEWSEEGGLWSVEEDGVVFNLLMYHGKTYSVLAERATLAEAQTLAEKWQHDMDYRVSLDCDHDFARSEPGVCIYGCGKVEE